MKAPALVIVSTHACRWCFVHDCAELDAHEAEFRAAESTRLLSLAAFRACPACGCDVNDGGQCVSVRVSRHAAVSS